jgi:hypothetical protein
MANMIANMITVTVLNFLLFPPDVGLQAHVGSLHSHHVSLVQWTPCLLPFTRGPGSNPQGGYLCETGILLLAMSRYIVDLDVIDPCGLL